MAYITSKITGEQKKLRSLIAAILFGLHRLLTVAREILLQHVFISCHRLAFFDLKAESKES